MSFSLFLIIFFSSLGGIFFLFAWGLYSVRRLETEELVENLNNNDSFLSGLNGSAKKNYRIVTKKFFCRECFFGRFCLRPAKNIFWKTRCLFLSFSDYIHGRHILEKNGCKGYWKKLDRAKKNGNGGGSNGIAKKETVDENKL